MSVTSKSSRRAWRAWLAEAKAGRIKLAPKPVPAPPVRPAAAAPRLAAGERT